MRSKSDKHGGSIITPLLVQWLLGGQSFFVSDRGSLISSLSQCLVGNQGTRLRSSFYQSVARISVLSAQDYTVFQRMKVLIQELTNSKNCVVKLSLFSIHLESEWKWTDHMCFVNQKAYPLTLLSLIRCTFADSVAIYCYNCGAWKWLVCAAAPFHDKETVPLLMAVVLTNHPYGFVQHLVCSVVLVYYCTLGSAIVCLISKYG